MTEVGGEGEDLAVDIRAVGVPAQETGSERFTNHAQYLSSTNGQWPHLPSSLQFFVAPGASCGRRMPQIWVHHRLSRCNRMMTSQVSGGLLVDLACWWLGSRQVRRRYRPFALSGECCIGCNSAYFCLGGEDPPEVVGGKREGPAAGAGQAGAGQGGVEQPPDPVDSYGPVLDADAALEDQRHRRHPDSLVTVVGSDEGDSAGLVADAEQDDAEDVRQLGGYNQETLLVGLARGDVQQRDD